MTHGEAAHERGTHNMFTGYKPSPALKYPSFGAVVSHEYGPRNNLPPYVCIPNQPNEFAAIKLADNSRDISIAPNGKAIAIPSYGGFARIFDITPNLNPPKEVPKVPPAKK